MDELARYITEEFGDRCPDFASGCMGCEVWKAYDDLMSKRGPLDEDEAFLAMHWIDRFAAGIDDYPQLDRLLPDELGDE